MRRSSSTPRGPATLFVNALVPRRAACFGTLRPFGFTWIPPSAQTSSARDTRERSQQQLPDHHGREHGSNTTAGDDIAVHRSQRRSEPLRRLG